MIYITGDTHGELKRFSQGFIPQEKFLKQDDYVIVCGDFMFVYRDDENEKKILDELEQKPYTILWVDGNHENFNALEKFPEEEWNGGRVHRIRKNIFHLMRDQVFTIEKKKFFTMGGAYSIDRYLRKKNITYWDRELPDGDEYTNAIENIKLHEKKFDYILTHTAPREIIRRMGYIPDPHDMELTGFLEWIMYECEFTHWYFGHFHEDKQISDKMTALLFDVVKIE